MASFSDAYTEALATAPRDVVLYDTFEFHHATFAEPARIAKGWDTIDARLEAGAPANGGEVVTWQAVPIEVSLPTSQHEALPRLRLEIHDASRLLMDPIEAAIADPQPLRVIYRPFMSSRLLQGPELLPPPDFYLSDIDIDSRVVSGRASLGDLLNRSFPRRTYTAADFPGLVRST